MDAFGVRVNGGEHREHFALHAWRTMTDFLGKGWEKPNLPNRA
jgi:hypothetical protein